MLWVTLTGMVSQKKSPGRFRGPSMCKGCDLLVHSVHTTMVVAAGRSFLLLRDLSDHGFGGEHEASNGRRVLQCSAGYLSGIDNTGLDQVLVDACSGVVAEV